MTITATSFGGLTLNAPNGDLNPGSLASAAGDVVVVVSVWFDNSTAVTQAAGTITSTPAKTFTKTTEFLSSSLGVAVHTWVSDGTTLTQIHMSPTSGGGGIGACAGGVVKVHSTVGTVTYDSTTKGTGTDATSPIGWSAGGAVSGTQIGFLGVVINNGTLGTFTASSGYTLIQEAGDGSSTLTNHMAYKVNETGTPALSVAYSAAIASTAEMFVSFTEPGGSGPQNLGSQVATLSLSALPGTVRGDYTTKFLVPVAGWPKTGQWDPYYKAFVDGSALSGLGYLETLAVVPTGAAGQNLGSQVATLALSANTSTLVVGGATLPSQVAALTLTPNTATLATGNATLGSQIATLTLTPNTALLALGLPSQIATLILTPNTSTLVVGGANLGSQIATLTITPNSSVLTKGNANLGSQIATLTFTAVPSTASASGAAQNLGSQVATLTFTPNSATLATGNVNLGSQIATLALTANPALLGLGLPSQVATLTLTPIAAVLVKGNANLGSQIATLTITPNAGTVTPGPKTLTQQIATLAFTAVPSTVTTAGGPQTLGSQIATLTLTPTPGTLQAAKTLTQQLATLALTAISGTLTKGNANLGSQVGLLTLTPTAGALTKGPATLPSQRGTLTLTATPSTVRANITILNTALAVYLGAVAANKIYVGSTQVWP